MSLLIASGLESVCAYDLASTEPEWLFFHCLSFIDNDAFFNRLTQVNKAHNNKMRDTRLYKPNSPSMAHILSERLKLTRFQVDSLAKSDEYAIDTLESCQQTIDKLWKIIRIFHHDVLKHHPNYDLPVLLQQLGVDFHNINQLPSLDPVEEGDCEGWYGFYSLRYSPGEVEDCCFLIRIRDMSRHESYIPSNEAARWRVLEPCESFSYDDWNYPSDSQSIGERSFADGVTSKEANDDMSDNMATDGMKLNEDEDDVTMSDEDGSDSSSEDEDPELTAMIIANDHIDVDEADWPGVNPFSDYDREATCRDALLQMTRTLPVALFMKFVDVTHENAEDDYDYAGYDDDKDLSCDQIGVWTGRVPQLADFEQVYASVDFSHVTDESFDDLVEQAHAHFSRSLPVTHAVDLACCGCQTSPVVGALFKRRGWEKDVLCDQCYAQRPSSDKTYFVFLGDWLHSLPTYQPLTLDESPIMTFQRTDLEPMLNGLSTRDYFLKLFGFLPRTKGTEELQHHARVPEALVSNVKEWLGVTDDESITSSAAAKRCKAVDALRRQYWENVMLLGYMKAANDIRERLLRERNDPSWQPLKRCEDVESDEEGDDDDHDPDVIDGVDAEWDDADTLNDQESDEMREKLAAFDAKEKDEREWLAASSSERLLIVKRRNANFCKLNAYCERQKVRRALLEVDRY